MSELKGACIFGQSGGPTSVINASAYGVIATALKNPSITRVLGAEHRSEERRVGKECRSRWSPYH